MVKTKVKIKSQCYFENNIGLTKPLKKIFGSVKVPGPHTLRAATPSHPGTKRKTRKHPAEAVLISTAPSSWSIDTILDRRDRNVHSWPQSKAVSTGHSPLEHRFPQKHGQILFTTCGLCFPLQHHSSENTVHKPQRRTGDSSILKPIPKLFLNIIYIKSRLSSPNCISGYKKL